VISGHIERACRRADQRVERIAAEAELAGELRFLGPTASIATDVCVLRGDPGCAVFANLRGVRRGEFV
jgi:hypothetical protein